VATEEPQDIPDRPLPRKNAFPIPSMFAGNLPWPSILHLVCTGVKEIPPFPLNTIEEVIEQLLPKGLAYVQLSGGEPCLHENFDDICIYLLDKGIPVYVLTSGIGYNIQHVWRKIAGHKQKNRIFDAYAKSLLSGFAEH